MFYECVNCSLGGGDAWKIPRLCFFVPWLFNFFCLTQEKDQRSLDINTAKCMLGLLLGKTWSLFPVFHQFLEVRRLKWNYFILSAFSDTCLIRYKINSYDFFLIFKIYQPLQYCTCNWLSLLSSCSSNPCAVKVYLTWDKV